MKTGSFWLDTAPPYRENSSFEGSARADVAVIGGGFAGLSAAYHLKKARPDLRVVLLESEFVGFGASGRNAGFAMNLFGLTLPLTALRFGKANARAARLFMDRAVGRVTELIAEHAIDADLQKGGLLAVATNKAQEGRIKDELRLCEKLGLTGQRWLNKRELRREVDSPTYLGAKHDSHCVLLNPAKYVRGLKSAAQALGVEIYERTPVLKIKEGAPLVLKLPKGELAAAKAILAANAYAGAFPFLRSKALPIHTYIAITRPLTPSELSGIGWGHRQGIEDARNMVHYYRLTADNRLLMGGGEALYHYGGGLGQDESVPTLERLKAQIARTFPSLAGVELTHHWGGPVSGTLDLAPAIGALKGRNIFYALGCIGHGVALMTLAGEVLRDLVLERDTEWTRLFFVNRFMTPLPPEPVRTAVARGILAALNLEDQWDERAPAR